MAVVDAALAAFAADVEREVGEPVPRPAGAGIEARVLLVLQDPGRLGSAASGILSPLENDDRTARNLRAFMEEAGLDPVVCEYWNAVPWDLRDAKPTPADVRRGAAYLERLVELLPELRAVVALGQLAQTACELARVEAIATWHPSPRGHNRPGRRDELVDALREAARLAAAEAARAPRRPAAPASSRRQARRTALFLLYQWDLTGQPLTALYEGEPDAFALGLAEDVSARAEALDARITATSQGWPADRMGTLERNVLRIGIHELEEGTVPPEVAINEAVVLAKRYASEDAARLVNGILARVAREQEVTS